MASIIEEHEQATKMLRHMGFRVDWVFDAEIDPVPVIRISKKENEQIDCFQEEGLFCPRRIYKHWYNVCDVRGDIESSEKAFGDGCQGE